MKSIILTGAAGGIGMAAVRRMVDAGFIVYAGAIDDWEISELEHLKSELNTEQIVPVRLDLRNKDDIETVVAKVEAQNLDLAALVTNGATSPIGVPFEHTDQNFFREVYEINVFGNLVLIRRCLDLLKQSKGRIVHVSSLFGKTSGAMQMPYASSKHSGEAIMMTLRRELMPYGIKVVITNPGCVRDTYMLAYNHTASKKLVAEMKNCTPDEVSTATFNIGKNTEIKHPTLTADPKYLSSYNGVRHICESFLVPNRMGSSPDDCAEAIMKGIQLKNPKTRYIVGLDSYLLIGLTWLLPEKLMDKIALAISLKD